MSIYVIYIGFLMATVLLPIKIDEDLKKAFISACNSNDSDASKELRKFIKNYISKNQPDLFKETKKQG